MCSMRPDFDIPRDLVESSRKWKQEQRASVKTNKGYMKPVVDSANARNCAMKQFYWHFQLKRFDQHRAKTAFCQVVECNRSAACPISAWPTDIPFPVWVSLASINISISSPVDLFPTAVHISSRPCNHVIIADLVGACGIFWSLKSGMVRKARPASMDQHQNILIRWRPVASIQIVTFVVVPRSDCSLFPPRICR